MWSKLPAVKMSKFQEFQAIINISRCAFIKSRLLLIPALKIYQKLNSFSACFRYRLISELDRWESVGFLRGPFGLTNSNPLYYEYVDTLHICSVLMNRFSERRSKLLKNLGTENITLLQLRKFCDNLQRTIIFMK